MSSPLSRFIAREGRMYSMAVGGVIRQEDITDYVPRQQEVQQLL